MAMAEKKKLGDILKEAGLIDDFQLQSALSHQRNWGGKLGNVIIEMGFVGEADISRVLAEVLGLPYADLFEPEIPAAVVNLIKPEVARKYQVMPVKKEGGSLLLAMTDPMDIDAIDGLRFATGLAIKPALALSAEISDAIRKYYDHENIVRTKTPMVFGKSPAPGKMEIIRGSDLTMLKDADEDPTSPILGREEVAQQSMADTKMRLEALISVLIEKGMITRDELVRRVYQKKMGL